MPKRRGATSRGSPLDSPTGLRHTRTDERSRGVNEREMVHAVQAVLARIGVADEISAAGYFEPRGHSGSMFAGGLIGGDLGDDIGGVADGIGAVGGGLAAQKAHDAASGLPEWMLVGVPDHTVYGFAADRAHHEAGDLVFRVDRAGLDVKVHQRVNVRVLELVHSDTGSCVELEGLRFPGQHAGAVIDALDR
jgi:hypothetical protein